jgi:hypothetical protein
MPPKGEPRSPASITALATHVLEVEVGRPDVFGDVLDVDPVVGPEAGRAARARVSTEAAGPSTEDAMRPVGCGIVVRGGEMLSKDGLIDDDVFAAVVDHTEHDGKGGGLGTRDIRDK